MSTDALRAAVLQIWSAAGAPPPTPAEQERLAAALARAQAAGQAIPRAETPEAPIWPFRDDLR
jgi:hypothetical protein